MANKYIIHGAANNGDGTASNEAASPGAAGAWNDINVLEGTTPGAGSLAAGDVVYIRSKSSAGADITRTLAADVNLGSAAATAAAPIYWILDNGAVWSGIDGILKYTTSSWNNASFIRENNVICAKTQDALVFENTSTTGTDGSDFINVLGHLIGAKIDASAKTATNRLRIYLQGPGILERPTIKWGRVGSAAAAQDGIFLVTASTAHSGHSQVIAPDIELLNSTVGIGAIFFIGSTNSQYRRFKVVGGRIYGAGAISGQAVFSVAGAATHAVMVDSVGLEFPRAMDANHPSATMFGSELNIIGCDGGVGGHLEAAWGYATSRTDNNPPTLSAALPDTDSTPWSWRVYPKAADMTYPLRLATGKMYTGAAAVKTITQELLVADTMAPTKRGLWATVEYIDNATGLPKHISTRDFAGGALDSSTANWSATTWGAVTLVKKKLEIATPTAIKPDTMIVVTLWGIDKSATANDIYFADPDFGVN